MEPPGLPDAVTEITVTRHMLPNILVPRPISIPALPVREPGARLLLRRVPASVAPDSAPGAAYRPHAQTSVWHSTALRAPAIGARHMHRTAFMPLPVSFLLVLLSGGVAILENPPTVAGSSLLFLDTPPCPALN